MNVGGGTENCAFCLGLHVHKVEKTYGFSCFFFVVRVTLQEDSS